MTKRIFSFFVPLATAFVLVACGSGGSGGQKIPDPMTDKSPTINLTPDPTPTPRTQSGTPQLVVWPPSTSGGSPIAGEPSSADTRLPRAPEDLQAADAILKLTTPTANTSPFLIPDNVMTIQGEWITPFVHDAWKEGWTGKDITIAVADDFTLDDLRQERRRVPKNRIINGVNRVVVEAITLTHGQIVSLIAGGERKLKVDYRVVGSRNTGSFEQGPYYGIAAEATLVERDVLTNQNGNTEAGTDLDLENIHILNLSLQSKELSLAPSAYWQNSLKRTTDSERGTLIVKAAGNKRVNAEWDMVNNALMESKYKDSTLIVGAIRAEDNSPAGHYSNAAGAYKTHFVVDVGSVEVGGVYVEGTSFAAPRVAGKAAILMQKFGGLTAAQYADIIKLTADDLGEKGVDEFYGHGRVNLERMLSPVGKMQ